jgi:ABC-2 type transport system ATP-binding protein
MTKDIAVTVQHVSKDFRLPHEKVDSVKSLFVNPFNKNRKKFETQHALDDITFTIPKGEFFGIVGRNGSGKSTLLKIIAGIYQPTEGTTSVNGRLVPFIELGVGFNPELTGRENAFMNGALMGFSEKEVEAKYGEIVEFAELERFMDQKLKNYSSGMQVRLAFSVATILAQSDILLIDEVLAVGDADFQRKCFEYFKELKKNKKTVIFVSHDMNAIREYCDRAVLIDNSKIVFEGTSEKTAKEYTRLFMPDQYSEDLKSEEKINNKGKWGLGGATIDSIKFKKKVLSEEDNTLDIIVQVTAKKEFEDGLIFGITVKNQQGEGLCGTNSRIIRQETKNKIKAGEQITLNWSMQNFFNEGKFIVEPALSDPNNMDVIAWWDDAAEFQVFNEERTPYKVAPKITLSVEER